MGQRKKKKRKENGSETLVLTQGRTRIEIKTTEYEEEEYEVRKGEANLDLKSASLPRVGWNGGIVVTGIGEGRAEEGHALSKFHNIAEWIGPKQRGGEGRNQLAHVPTGRRTTEEITSLNLVRKSKPLWGGWDCNEKKRKGAKSASRLCGGQGSAQQAPCVDRSRAPTVQPQRKNWQRAGPSAPLRPIAFKGDSAIMQKPKEAKITMACARGTFCTCAL